MKIIKVNGQNMQLELGTINTMVLEDGNILEVCLKTKERLYQDPHWLKEQYEVNGLSMAKIASICSVTPMAIQNWLRRHGIETRPRGYQPKA